MPPAARVDLIVPYAEKEDAKALGARWDVDRKVWYAPPGIDVSPLGRWVPKGFPPQESDDRQETGEPERGMALIDLLAQVRVAIEGAIADAVWVRAEVSELRGKNGHLYPTLTQRNERGDVLAQTSAAIWKGRATAITRKFVEATGEGLKTDIKILCLAKVRFDVLYGLDLIIEDVDPSFTLGDLAAKLRRIRDRLAKEQLFDLNKGLPAPAEFVRVAVISPETWRAWATSAGRPTDSSGLGSATSSITTPPSRASTHRPRSERPSTRPSPPTGCVPSTPWSSSGAAAP